MDILTFPVRFPQSQPSFSPNFSDPEHCGDYLEHLKEREARLEARKKALCYGGKDDSDHVDAGSVSRNDHPPIGDEDASDDDDDDMHSTSSYSVNEASEGGHDDDVDEEIPFDDSEVEEVVQPPDGNDLIFDIETIPHSPQPDNPDELVEEDEVLEVGWADTDEEGASSQSDA